MKKVTMSIVGDNVVSCSMDMTEEECAVIQRFLATAVRDGEYAPSIYFSNPWEEERKKAAEEKKRKKMLEEKRIDEEKAHLAYMREHGPFAVAYRNALANKRG